MSRRSVREAIARTVVRRCAAVALAWLLACALLLPNARRVASVLSVSARVDGSESAAVDGQLRHRFRSPFAHSVVLVVSGVPSPRTSDGSKVLRAIVDSVQQSCGVTRVLSYLDGRDPLFVGAEDSVGGTFLVVGLDERQSPDALLDSLRLTTIHLRTAMRRVAPAIALRLTGQAALNADLRRTSAADARGAEWRALPLTFLLLIVSFGAVVAALLPVAGAMLTIGVSLGLAVLVAHLWSLSILLQNVV